MAIYVGIDLGTSNTILAMMTDDGVRPLEPFGYANLPSCLIVTQDGQIQVGNKAKNRRSRFSDRYIANSKPHMPNKKTWTIDGVTYTPKDAAREVLKAAVTAIREETGIGDDEEIRAVITVPACFSSLACTATQEAAVEAGLTCLKLQMEPVAAAMAYSGQLHNARNVLVIDTGGGTFDLALVHVDSRKLLDGGANCFQFDRSNDVGGDANLGGNDFDKVILEKFLLPNLMGTSDGNPQNVSNRDQLLEDMATNVKEYLQGISITECHKAYTFPDGTRIDITVTEEEYINACGELLSRMSFALNDLMSRTTDGVDKILMVGGMANDPCIRKLVSDMYPDIPAEVPEQYMNMIAAGAAVEAWDISNGGLGFRNAITYTALGIAVDAEDGTDTPIFSAIINRGESISPNAPLVATPRRYSNSYDNATSLSIVILESTGSTKLADCTIHGNYIVRVPPKPKHENHIRVEMSLDVSRVLTVQCFDNDTNEQLMHEVVQLI